MSEEHDCKVDGCEWFVWGGEDIHSIQENYDGNFEAIVNAIIRCKHCDDEHTVVFNAES
jgi:hypothetical protein